MKKICFIVWLAIFYLNAGYSQIYQWAYNIAGNGGNCNSIAVDAGGNVYIAGKSNVIGDFDPGPGIVNVAPGVFMAKYTSTGALVWAESFAAKSVKDIALDASNNIYIVGDYSSTTDFDPGPAVSNRTLGTTSTTGAFIAKYDANGNYIWATTYYCCNDNCYNSIALNSTGTSAYVTGYNGQTNADIIFAQYSCSTGTQNWFRPLVSSTSGTYDGGTGIAVDNAGNCYITGYFRYNDFDPSSATAYVVSTGTTLARDVFIAKYTSSGTYVWAENVGSISDDGEAGVDIEVDASSNIYITGNFKGSADMDPGAGTYFLNSMGLDDIFLAKYSSSGSFIYAKSFGSPANDYTHRISVKLTGETYITGEFQNTIDFDPGIGVSNLGSNGGSDVFFARYDAFGNYTWAYSLGNTSTQIGWGITQDASNVYLCGESFGIVDFDPGAGTANLDASIGGPAYFAKYSDCAGVPSQPGAISGNTSICAGASSNYSVSPVAGSTSYSWSFPSGWSGSSTTNTIPVILGNTSGNLSVTANNACGSSSASVLSVTIHPTPTITVNSGAICTGQSFTIVPGGANTYTFSSGSAIVSPTINASYSVSGTSSFGCVSSSPAVSIVTVNPLPTITANTSNSIICGPPYQGTATLNASGASTYTWNTSAITSSISVSPSVTTQYTVIGTDSNGCENTAIITQSVSACTEISELSTTDHQLLVYPNPTYSLITLMISPSPNQTSVEIFNSIGERVYTVKSKEEKLTIDLSALTDGIYFIKAGDKIQKIIKNQ